MDVDSTCSQQEANLTECQEFDESTRENFVGKVIDIIDEYLAHDHAVSAKDNSISNNSKSNELTSGVIQRIKELLQGHEATRQNLITDIIVDALWFFGNQTYGDPSVEEKWTKLCQLVKEIATSKTVPIATMRLSLDLNLLVGAGLSSDESNLSKILVRINTKILYRQQKYNLLREETEGFSKLAATLQNIPQINEDCSNFIKNIFSIIGQFDLDPNRVLDVIITSFEQYPKNLSFLKLMKCFRESHIVHILGQKFLFHTDGYLSSLPSSESATTAEIQCKANQEEDIVLPAPESLYSVTAALIGSGIVNLSSLLAYIQPPMSVIVSDCDKEDLKLVKNVNEYGVISLNSAKKDTSQETSAAGTSELNGSLTKPSNVLFGLSTDAYANGYHIIGIAASLLEIKCLDLALPLLIHLDEHSIDPIRFDCIRKSTQQLLLAKIEGVYNSISMKKLCLARSKSTKQNQIINEAVIVGEYLKQDSVIDDMEVFTSASAPLIRLLGHRLGDDPILFTKICRLIKHRLASPTKSDEEVTILTDLIGSVFLPSITANEGSVFLVSQVWAAISSLPFASRYAIYDAWYCTKTGKSAMNIKHVDVVFCEAKALQQTKALLKRLAKENTKIIGRQLAKVAHFSPLVVFEYILNQIEHYDNLIPYVVEALKYTSDIAKDTLSYFFVVQLQRDGNKLRSGQTQFSAWFSTLSKFIAHFYKRYPTTELRGLIHYLLKKLGDGESLDLLVLKNLLSVMGGCETMLEVSSSQLDGLSGGKILRGEIMGAAVKDPPSKRAVRILRDEFMSSNAAIPLLLFIAQIRGRILYCTEATELKLISHLYDMAQDVLMQFTDFLMSGSKSVETIVLLMPTLPELVGDIGLSLPIAFQLVRPILRAALAYGQEISKCPDYLQQWHPFNPIISELIQQNFPDNVWECMSPQLYVLFWSLSVYDISIPNSAYSLEIKRLKDRYSELERKTFTSVGGYLNGPGSGVLFSHADAEKANKQKKTDLSKILSTIKDLTAEQESQKKHVEGTRKILTRYREEFFLNSSSSMNPTIISEYIIQYCVVDRANLSPADAIFCSQFFFLLHDLQVNYFSTLQYMNHIIKSVTPLLFCSTEAEASFIGFLISDVLATATRWNQSHKLFDIEAKSKIGFAVDISGTVLKIGNGESTEGETNAIEAVPQSDRIDYDSYVKVFNLWQNNIRVILHNAFTCSEYMYLRSALVFLTHVATHFPTTQSVGNEILKDVETLEKQEVKRPDLQVMAKSVWAMLKRRSMTWQGDGSTAVSKPLIALVDKPTNENGVSHLARADSSGGSVNGIEAGEEPEDLVARTSSLSENRGNKRMDERDEDLPANKRARSSITGPTSIANSFRPQSTTPVANSTSKWPRGESDRKDDKRVGQDDKAWDKDTLKASSREHSSRYPNRDGPRDVSDQDWGKGRHNSFDSGHGSDRDQVTDSSIGSKRSLPQSNSQSKNQMKSAPDRGERYSTTLSRDHRAPGSSMHQPSDYSHHHRDYDHGMDYIQGSRGSYPPQRGRENMSGSHGIMVPTVSMLPQFAESRDSRDRDHRRGMDRQRDGREPPGHNGSRR